MSLKAGDRVLFHDFGGASFKVENDVYTLFKEDDILASISDQLSS